ncbi:SIS domain-containing protein [Demequina sp. NBRC 110052]|uniref:SIS domain-containing protein n=1 Tax=Demequina sp. NBRC 110052 TaxID=1570341 RepID=UPI0009FE5011|nr:SIS domain-containing protein [Demequina sp. NBRC 110052]
MHHNELDRARAFIESEGAAVSRVARQLDTSFVEVADAMMKVRGKVIVSGAGTSGTIARRLAHLLTVSGTPAFYQNPTDALHGSSGVAMPGDMLIAISKGGDSGEITDLLGLVKERGATTVALTATADSPLARAADSVVVVDSPNADPGGIIAMGSTLATAAWGDALAITLMTRRGYKWEQVLHSHPGGAVGKHAAELLDQVGSAEV